ncbi:mannose-6-phosphate isomerase, class I [archaeon]|nr:MAG: mannose-6-phosphate isomerase, class I [archaeon]
MAKRLHVSFPEQYKDPNHKPEMVIALTDFEAICGFRTVASIRGLLAHYPEFAHLLKLSGYDVMKDTSTSEHEVLRSLFNAYMRSKEVDSKFQLELMLERLGEESKSRKLSDIEDLMLRLNEQFPGDNGVFCPIIMNYLKMKPGDSFFICANEPHAYLSGDCAECMALSDNVVRAGLTPKFKDVDTLCNMLTYRAGAPSFLTPIRIDPYTVVYRPPGDRCAEFEVEHIKALQSIETPLLSIPTASLLLMLDGQDAQLEFKGTSASENVQQLIGSCHIRVGMVVFLAAGTAVTVKSETASAVFMRAHINLS